MGSLRASEEYVALFQPGSVDMRHKSLKSSALRLGACLPPSKLACLYKKRCRRVISTRTGPMAVIILVVSVELLEE